MTKQEQQELIEKLKDDVFELRQELKFKNERLKNIRDIVNTKISPTNRRLEQILEEELIKCF